MALPRLDTSPKYQMNVPSTGKSVTYRPFLVKEEKNLMIAMETNDQKSIMLTLLDTIKSCVDEDINTKTLTSFDMEYMFLQLRSKSVGENTKVQVECEHCQTNNVLEIPIDDIKVEIPEVDSKVKLTDTLILELGWPAASTLIEGNISENPNTEELFDIMANCFKYIETEEERIDFRNESKEEIQAFIESMNSTQFESIKEYINSMPRLKHDVSFTCKNCNALNNKTVEGLNSFLS